MAMMRCFLPFALIDVSPMRYALRSMCSSFSALPPKIFALSAVEIDIASSHSRPSVFFAHGQSMEKMMRSAPSSIIEQSRIGEETRRRDPEVLAEDVAEVEIIVPGHVQRVVDTPQQERDALAHVAEDDLQVRVLVEHAGQHHAHALRHGLHGVAERRRD